MSNVTRCPVCKRQSYNNETVCVQCGRSRAALPGGQGGARAWIVTIVLAVALMGCWAMVKTRFSYAEYSVHNPEMSKMTVKEKAFLLALARREPGADTVRQNDQARMMIATRLDDLGYVDTKADKGLYGLTVAKCEITDAGQEWLAQSEFRHLLPKEFIDAKKERTE